MSEAPPAPGWWLASDGKWYPPRAADEPPAPGWWLASDGKWYPPRAADEPPATGWWLASNGKWYPPEKKPGSNRPTGEQTAAAAASQPSASATSPAPSPAPASATSPAPASGAPTPSADTGPADTGPADAARPVAKKVAVKKVVKKVAAKPPTAGTPSVTSAAAPAAKAPTAGTAPARPAAAPAAKAPTAAKPSATAPSAKAVTTGSATGAGPVTRAGGGVVRRQDLDDLDGSAPLPARSPQEQIAIRNQSSKKDAAFLATARAAAASRALSSLQAQIKADLSAAPSTGTASTRPSSPATRPPATKPPVAAAPAAKAPPAKAPATRTPAASSPAAKAPAAKAPAAKAPAAKAPAAKAPAAQAPAPNGDADGATINRAPTASKGGDVPLMEVKPSPVASDIDRIGERLVIFEDRVELHDRTGKVRDVIRGDQIADVVVARRFTGHAVTVEAGDGSTIQAKGLRPEQAEEIRELVMRRTRRGGPAPDRPATDRPASDRPASDRPASDRPAPAPGRAADGPTKPTGAGTTPAAAFSVGDLLDKLDDLHAAGVLTDAELSEKRALVARIAGGERLAPTRS